MLSNQMIGKEVQKKVNKKWETTFFKEFENSAYAHDIYIELTNELIHKKLEKCTYIKSIKRIQLYNGYIKIIITYDNNFRTIYVIESL